MSGIYIIYPERRTVSPTMIMAWAKEAFKQGDIDNTAEDVEDAIFLLENANLITVQDRGIF